MSSRTSQWHSVSQVRGRGGKGRRDEPLPLAHRLSELHCAYRVFFARLFSFCACPRFPEKNFAPGSNKSDDSNCVDPIASAALTLVLVAAVRIHSEVSMLPTTRAGISAFAGQFGFIVR